MAFQRNLVLVIPLPIHSFFPFPPQFNFPVLFFHLKHNYSHILETLNHFNMIKLEMLRKNRTITRKTIQNKTNPNTKVKLRMHFRIMLVLYPGVLVSPLDLMTLSVMVSCLHLYSVMNLLLLSWTKVQLPLNMIPKRKM